MFNRKQREIERLNAENAKLQERVAAVEGDPYYLLAQEMGAEVEGVLSGGGPNVDAKVNDVIARRRAATFMARVELLAAEQIAQDTAEQKAEIEAAARVRAGELAAAALRRFLTEEAGAYRDEVSARLDAELPATVVREAKQQIQAEEHQRRVEAAKAKILAARTEEGQRTVYKNRAQELRALTKKTGILRLDMLEDGDPLTMVFTRTGNGRENLTVSDGYGGSTYQSHLETRKISGNIIDTASSLFEVEKDSWAREIHRQDLSLRGGQQIRLLAHDPLAEAPGELAPCLVKAQPLTFQTLGGVTLGATDHELWWVNLHDFKVLS